MPNRRSNTSKPPAVMAKISAASRCSAPTAGSKIAVGMSCAAPTRGSGQRRGSPRRPGRSGRSRSAASRRTGSRRRPGPAAPASVTGPLETTVHAVGGDHRQGEPGLEVGLLEAGVHPPGIGRLELGVQVGALVRRVDEPVQTFPAAAVVADRLHGELVRAGRRRSAAAASRRTPAGSSSTPSRTRAARPGRRSGRGGSRRRTGR